MRPFGSPDWIKPSAGLSVVGVVAGVVCSVTPAQAQFAQESPHDLELDMVFHSGNYENFAKVPDCRSWSTAMRDFNAMREAGETIITVKGKQATALFIEYAYRNNVFPIEYENLESLFFETVSTDRFRVFTGNESRQVVCGFDRPYYLDKLWLDAGLQGKLVPIPQRPSSPLAPLLSAYRWQKYSLVRPSLLQRGYSAFTVPEPVAKRCAPTTEPLCEEYPEAVCDSDLLNGITCMFVFQRDGTRQLVGVIASVEHLTAYTARITVNDLRELQKTAE